MAAGSLLPIVLALAAADAPAGGEAAPSVEGNAAQPGEPVPPPPPADWEARLGADTDDAMIEGRRRPGYEAPLPERVTQENQGAIRPPPPEAFPTDQIPLPDRWRLIQTLGVVKERWFDPYHQNTYKGDRPICIPSEEEKEKRKEEGLPACATPKLLGLKGEDWFFAVNAVSDTVVEPRSFPLPVGIQYPNRPGSNDVFGRSASLALSQTFLFGAALIKGQTAFKPPDYEYRLTLAYNVNYANVQERRILYIQPSYGTERLDHFLGVQEAFVDKHWRNVSDRFDFDSIRVGIQPFQTDFRGFLFNDNQLGIRLFGNRDNNRFQYNLAAFWRLEKDTNSGLNSVVDKPRKDFVFVANLYRQDFLIPGLTSEIIVAWNHNREGGEVFVDDNGFPVRPALIGNLAGRDYDVVYLGYAADGHVGRINLTATAYGLFGTDRMNVFTGRAAKIRAFFAAGELSYDVNWARFRLSGLWASADKEPFDDIETGYDAIFENPVFAGADTSYWIRQSVPFIGGARAVGINGRNGVLNSLRSSKEQGQSNFINPGTQLIGVGGDFDLTPQFRVSANANHLWFVDTTILEDRLSRAFIARDIGWDLSLSTVWRPKATQNIVLRFSGSALLPGAGFERLFANSGTNRNYYSILANLVLSY
ncbi:MAG: hypothetical protein QM690_05470 [Sphingobium sp.]